jgi:hypothetical protein
VTEDDLILDLARFERDPYAFVMWAFPWGVPGTDLEYMKGPEPWQAEILRRVGKGTMSLSEVTRLATTSGHGVGKSALVAWLILWAMSTFEDTIGVVTANTETQLKTKTWVQVATWFRRFIAKDLFKLTATALFSRDPDRERTWRIDMVPWSERNTEAFAGLHNRGKRILLVFDEASAIPDMIWEVAEGALTDRDTQILWAVFGNPTRNKGRFRDCFPGGQFAHRWQPMKVDSRQVTFTNKEQIAEWIADYGEDSDFIRVRVKGEFPRTDSESFISFEVASGAVGRLVEPQIGMPLILGVDVGRFGDDPTCIYPRRGRDASSLKPELIYKTDIVTQASIISHYFNTHHADWCFVDEGGVGGGLVDNLRRFRIPVIGVQFGAKPDGLNDITYGVKYANKRAEIWGGLRDWLPFGSIAQFSIATLSGSPITLVDELIGPTYGLNNREEIQLERKKDMRSRGVPSPNVADALATTFAFPHYFARAPILGVDDNQEIGDAYDPFAKERIYA